jgi:hypothetical protein
MESEFFNSSSSASDDEIDHDVEPIQKQTGSKRSGQVPGPKAKRQRKEQSFVETWLERSEFKKWLQAKRDHDGKRKPFCKICSKTITCSKTGLQRHLKSKSHENKVAALGSKICAVNSLFENNRSTAVRRVKSMEIKICAFLAEHDLAISISDNLVELLRSLFPKDDMLKTLTLGKQKATNVIRQVLGFDYLHEVVTTLQSQFFSIIIDETTDLSTIKQLAIIATYFDMNSFESKYHLVDMVEVEDGTARGIYSALRKTFSELQVPMKNIIGYSSDTTNVMFGEHNSVSQLLKSEVPHVKLVKCSCHLIHLVSSYAALKLPKSLEDLCRDIFAHFHRSSKRQDVYKEFQSFFSAEPVKILSPGQTRWLSLQACVDRILEQFEALRNYFTLVVNEDPTHSNDRIHKSLENKFTLAYLEFLSYQLERFNSFNVMFQSERPLHGSFRE